MSTIIKVLINVHLLVNEPRDLQHQFTGVAWYIFECYTSIAKYL